MALFAFSSPKSATSFPYSSSVIVTNSAYLTFGTSGFFGLPLFLFGGSSVPSAAGGGGGADGSGGAGGFSSCCSENGLVGADTVRFE